MAVEIDEHFASHLKRQFPRVHIINDSAEHLDTQLQSLGHSSADCVLSVVPASVVDVVIIFRVPTVGRVVIGCPAGVVNRGEDADTARGEQKWENRNYGSQCEEHERRKGGLIG